MRTEFKVAGLWVLGGALSWLVDVVLDPCFRKMPFTTLFFCGSSHHDLFMRSYILGSFLLFAAAGYVMTARRVSAGRALAAAVESVAEAEKHTLKGLLPICSYCKRIRDDKGAWTRIETYIMQHSKALFTHGICPDCEQKNMMR